MIEISFELRLSYLFRQFLNLKGTNLVFYPFTLMGRRKENGTIKWIRVVSNVVPLFQLSLKIKCISQTH